MHSAPEAISSQATKYGSSEEGAAAQIDYAKGGKKPHAKRLGVAMAALLFALAGDLIDIDWELDWHCVSSGRRTPTHL